MPDEMDAVLAELDSVIAQRDTAYRHMREMAEEIARLKKDLAAEQEMRRLRGFGPAATRNAELADCDGGLNVS